MAHFCKKLQADCRRGWMLALTAMLIVFAPAAFAQSAPTVTGTVTDQSGQPVIGATIIEQGTTNGATTGVDGSYSLKLRGGGNSANLIFQSLGFVSQTVAVNGRTKIDVKLAEDAVALDAVVAIGYGTVKQKDLTTAVSVVKTDDLARRPITSASGALQGKAAGVQVIQPNGSPGQGMVVRVRGASSISSSNDPLYVVDGVPVGEGNYAIAYLSPNEIESMQVLKDASSAAIYGSRAANGVVLITTKQGSRKRGPEISFSTFVGISKVTKSYDVLNARQYRDLMEENRVNFMTAEYKHEYMKNGICGDGNFIDNVLGADYITHQIRENLYEIFIANKKIAYTDDGFALVAAGVFAALNRAVELHIIATDPEDDTGVYTVVIPKRADATDEQARNRQMPDIKWSAQLEGAVHSVKVNGTLRVTLNG